MSRAPDTHPRTHSTRIVNPKTGRNLRIGSAAHIRLIATGVVSRETLDGGKVSIVEGSRQKMPRPQIESHAKSTHLTNVPAIAEAIGCSVFVLLEWLHQEFSDMKICFTSSGGVRVIFPSKEPYLESMVLDFAQQYAKDRGLDSTHWNQ